MSRFIALLYASDPDLLANIENAGGQVVSVSEPGFVVIDGDQSVADSVYQLDAVQAVGPVDSSWDTSEMSLGDDVGTLVSAWNTSYSEEYQAALSDPYRYGEEWDFPGGCDPEHLGTGGDGGDGGGGGPLVADNGDGTGTGTTDGTGTGTGTGTGDGTGDGTSEEVASNDPPPDDGWGSWDTNGTDGQQSGGQPA